MEQVKIGIIGTGAISYYHLKQIQAIPHAKITAAYNRTLVNLRKFAQQAQLPESSQYTDYDEFLEHRELDAVINCLPNSLHAQTTIDALNSDKHVLCEKPMATNYSDAKKMVKAANKNKKKLLIGLTRRFSGDVQHAKRVAENGELGDIYYINVAWMRRSGIPGWGSWFTREKDAGAGPIYDIGVHVLDTALWIADNFEPEQALASSYAKFGPDKKALGDWGTHNHEGYYDVEDLSSALIKMKNGATVSFEVSWAAHVPRSQFSVMLLGEKAGLDMETMTLHSAEAVEIDRKLEYTKTDAYYEEMKHFTECIIKDESPVTTPDQMLNLQKTLDMILLSCRENRAVNADEIQ